MRVPLKIVEENGNGSNPIHTNPDPYIIRWKDSYYVYSSGNDGIKVLHSKDLQSFTEYKYAYKNEQEYSYWAPALFERKGIFHLYYSSLKKGETDDHLHFLRVATSSNPLGPFVYKATLTDYFSIDPHVIQSGDSTYIYYAANIQENTRNGRIGTAIWLDELLTPFQMAGKAKPVLLPSIDEEIFARNRFGDGKDWHTLEGPYYLSDGENSWLMYSGNAFTSPDYFVGYARGRKCEDLRQITWDKYPSDNEYQPLVREKNKIEGTGHNSVTQAPDHITPIIVYHGRIQGGKTNAAEDDREMFIDYMWRENQELKTNAPSKEGIKSLPYPDICYLEEIARNEGEWGSGGEVVITRDFKIALPKRDSLYIELCILSEEGSINIFASEDARNALVTLEGNYWQRIGILFMNHTVRIRKSEEWIKPILCEKPTDLFFKLEGSVKLQYLDCTFLQADGGNRNPLSCLL